jgi:intraflagellar transport protein 88
MTSAKGAGYSSKQQEKDPFHHTTTDEGPAPPLQQPGAQSVERQARDLERAVNTLLEESALANSAKEYPKALERAKEAAKRERILCRHREKNGMADQVNFDLTYSVYFNLANQYSANQMFTEALATYNVVVKNKQYPQAGRLRVNMGNIYYQQKNYPSAIKMYRMAMDQIGGASKELRFKIMRNIGNSFIRLGQFQDAIQAYEQTMDSCPDAQTGFNLIVCYYALGDTDKMKRGFQQLINVPEFDAEEEEEPDLDDVLDEEKKPKVQDILSRERKLRKESVRKFIRNAAQLIAPVIEPAGISAGWDHLVEVLNMPDPNGPQGVAGPAHPEMAQEMEIAKGCAFLKHKQIGKAIDVFKKFEKQDAAMVDAASTNLAFLYFLENDMENADKYAEKAMKADRYNSKALVNKANILFTRGEFEQAKQLFLEAVGLDGDCVEAIYNLGLTNKKLSLLDDALKAFKKLHRMVPKDPQVLYQMANLYDLLGDTQHAIEWFKILYGNVPSDPKSLARLGTLYNTENDETQAFHNFSDSYNYYPVNMEVISWLGVWYVKSELYENAIKFFQRAAEVEPDEVKWQLMVATCYRRMGDLRKALSIYEAVHKQDVDNVECLRYLVTICKEMNDLESADAYTKALKKAERVAEAALHTVDGGDDGYMKGDVVDQLEMAGNKAKNKRGGSARHDRDDNAREHERVDNSGRGNITPSRNLEKSFDNSVDAKLQGTKANRGVAVDEDWGDDDLGDELLPL